MEQNKKAGRILSVLLALALWQAAALCADLKVLLPGPWQVLCKLAVLWREPEFLASIGFSLGRIFLGFTLAFFCAGVLALLSARFSWVEVFLWPYVVTVKTVPVASFIIICLIWMKASVLPTFISFLMVFPLLYSNVLHGVRETDTQLLEMAKVYKIPYFRKLRHIILPQVQPYLLSASSVGLGMAWKSGVAAEVIAVAGGSLGERLYEAKVHFMVPELLAWTVVIVLLSVGMEKLVMHLLRRVFARLKRG